MFAMKAQVRNKTDCHPSNLCDIKLHQTAKIRFHQKVLEAMAAIKRAIHLGNRVRSNEDIKLEMAKLIKDNRIFLNNNTFSHEEASMEVLLAKKRIFKLIQAWDVKQIESWSLPALLLQLLNDSRTIDEMLKQQHSVQYKEYLENSSNTVTTVLPTEEPEYSLSMGYVHLSTIPETESDEVINSSVEKLFLIPREYEVTLEDESECDLPVCEDHYEILSDSNNDDISSDDDTFEDIMYVEAALLDSELVSLEEENAVFQEEKEFNLEDILQIQDVILREKLLSINRLVADIESLNENPTFNLVLNDHTEETRSGNITTHANNSFLEYDLFCFEIEPDQGRLTNVVKNDISNNSTNDPLLEEVDLFLASDNSIPPGIGNIDYDSEGDIYFLEELLVDDSISIPKNESYDFDHQDNPSFPRLLRNHQMLSFTLILSLIQGK
nr:hypothetical protein [Tanacetum cinerariifolium]